MGAQHKLMSEASRALLRHAVGTYYRDATRVHENGAAFIWQRTYHDTLRRFRDAVLRRGYAMRRLFVHRKYTNLVGTVSDNDRAKFAPLATISPSGHTQLSAAFTSAITNAKASADAAYQAQQRSSAQHGRDGRAGRRTAPHRRPPPPGGSGAPAAGQGGTVTTNN